MSSADAELLQDKIEVSLDGRQIFYLFFGGAVIASLVFVLGVMVGRRLEARSYVADTAQTSAALDPLAALDQLSAQERSGELLFRSALAGDPNARPKLLGAVDRALARQQTAPKRPSKVGAGAPAAGAVPRRGKKPIAAKAPAKPAEGVRSPRSFAEVASARSAGPSKRAPAPGPRPTVADAPVAKPAARSLARPAPAATGSGKPLEVAAGPVKRADPAPAAGPVAKAGRPTAAPPASVRRKGRFTLQVSAFRSRAEAEAFHGKLSASGYEPYIVAADVDGKGTWYRVRLGRYLTHTDALNAKASFEREQRIIAYVTRVRR